jgi:nucleotide-binding universal stress UspA family protein
LQRIASVIFGDGNSLIRNVYELQTQIKRRGNTLLTKILVGVDGSESSEKALDTALEIADKFSASVLILNVFQPPPEFEYNLNLSPQPSGYGNSQATMNYPSIYEEFRKIHEAVLSKATERAIKLKPDLKITSELKEGDASSQIVETAANGEFDLIVIGHRGDSKIKELFLGSTSERIAHRAACAVLITK